MVVTSVSKTEGRDIIQQSRHHQQKREGRDNRSQDLRSRHQLHREEVATSLSSRESLQGIKVATSLSSRDNRSKEKRLRHPLQRPEGCDIIQWSQHQLPGKEVATSFSYRDNSCIERRSRHHLAVTTSVQRDLGSRQHLAVATSNQRDANYKSRPHKSLCDVVETTKVTTMNRGRDINNKMGQLI